MGGDLVLLFGASVLGSAHCVAMCGPYVAMCTAQFVPKGATSAARCGLRVLFNLGRIATYSFIGLIAGVVCFIAATSLKHVLGYDDSLDAFGVHGIGGIVGALLTGVFVSKEISGVDGSLLIQLVGVGVTVIYGFAASFIILRVIDKTIGLRVTEEQEREGLDISLHGESIE